MTQFEILQKLRLAFDFLQTQVQLAGPWNREGVGLGWFDGSCDDRTSCKHLDGGIVMGVERRGRLLQWQLRYRTDEFPERHKNSPEGVGLYGTILVQVPASRKGRKLQLVGLVLGSDGNWSYSTILIIPQGEKVYLKPTKRDKEVIRRFYKRVRHLKNPPRPHAPLPLAENHLLQTLMDIVTFISHG